MFTSGKINNAWLLQELNIWELHHWQMTAPRAAYLRTKRGTGACADSDRMSFPTPKAERFPGKIFPLSMRLHLWKHSHSEDHSWTHVYQNMENNWRMANPEDKCNADVSVLGPCLETEMPAAPIWSLPVIYLYLIISVAPQPPVWNCYHQLKYL